MFDWSKYTPPDFKFAVKLNRLITHEKMLEISKGMEEDLKRFCELLKPLMDSGKLACILIQLPPGLKFKEEKIEPFLKILPKDIHFALEYRNKSWLGSNVSDMLSRYKIAAVVVDEPLLAPDLMLTSDFCYVRWHGRGEKIWYNYHYSWDELSSWIQRLKEMSQKVDVYGNFNNHYHSYAPENCIDVLDMLGLATPEQKATRKRISEFRKGGGPVSIDKTFSISRNMKKNQ